MKPVKLFNWFLVIHRVGGLEEIKFIQLLEQLVIHRVGGLDVFRMLSVKVYLVIHRVGGLEE